MNPLLLGVLGYVAAQIVFGVIVARRISTEEDYLVAGRKLGPTVALFTIFATWFGAETCIGAAGRAFSGGLSETPAEPFGYALCLLFMGLVFAVPLWRMRLLTLADFFRQRYGAGAESLSVFLMVPTSVLWAGAQVRAFGQILSAISDLDVTTGVTLAALVVVVYTALGGLLADAWSDLLQGLVLVAGLLLLGALFFRSEGLAALSALPAERLSLNAGVDSIWDFGEAWAVPILGSVLAQEMVARVMASRSARVARRATVGAAALYFGVGLIPVTLGLAAFGRVEVEHPEQILIAVGTEYLPPILGVVFVGALVSAILSTVDSALLVAGSLTAHNLILRASVASATEKRRVLVNRAAVVGAGIVAYLLALSSEGVYDLVQEASGFGSAGIFVSVVLGMFTAAGRQPSAVAAMAAALVVYAAGAYGGLLAHPFLWSLAAALFAYIGALALSPPGAPALHRVRPDRGESTR
jgi:Na+/proline symporter